MPSSCIKKRPLAAVSSSIATAFGIQVCDKNLDVLQIYFCQSVSNSVQSAPVNKERPLAAFSKNIFTADLAFLKVLHTAVIFSELVNFIYKHQILVDREICDISWCWSKMPQTALVLGNFSSLRFFFLKA